ncbi:ATP-dependent helicase HrpB [Leucobacter ruminantium]|uniref:ATP-dependent helicase HrpB n=1 Tax=Leucobacter ruminantium TaxID=1289170 RepID=A0A939RXM0_9MICO|nr:ATP-dependent helicase HrpB [Leucobacter ruminantium]
MTSHRFDLDAIGAGLPVAATRAELERAATTGAAVVTAPPGTGKTTFVPPLVANLVAARGGGTTLLTQPRRVAVRAAASRIASLDGGAVGDIVGFTVRGERKVGPGTRIEALTPGVLLRRLIADPGLDGVGAVILDEVHERSVEGDLLLGMVAEVRALRDDLLVVAMSATLDAERIAEILGEGSSPAPVVDVPSPLHPLRVDYRPFDGARLTERGVSRDYLAHLAATAAKEQAAAAAHDPDACDALVFVPGAREVDEVVRLLRTETAREAACTDGEHRRVEVPILSERQRVEVLPLHGRIPAREQDRAVRGRAPGDPPRIVVSTSLAESSLTVPGVRLVIDSGLAREVRRDRARDMTGLVTVSASRASAEQRAGRAARQGPGRAVRVYSETDFARMPAAAAPEIASADLVDTALLLAAWGTPGGEGLALPTPPPPQAMARAQAVLHTLGLTDAAGRVTSDGAEVARMPVGVREARALLEGVRELRDPTSVSEVVAAVSDDHREPGADLPRLLRELRSGRAPGAERWRREARRLARLVPPPTASDPEAEGPGLADASGAVLALARPEWIARRTGEGSRSYLFASGTRAALPERSGLIGVEWLSVREVQRADGRAADGTGAVIRLAAPLPEEDALRFGDALTTHERVARIVDGRVRVREERRLGAIPLASAPASPTRDDTGPALAAHLRETGLAALDWREEAIRLRARLALLRRELGDPWPAVDDDALLDGLERWLGPDLDRMRPDASLGGIDVAAALARLLPWPEATRLLELAPERLAVPSGSHIRIDYPRPGDDDALPVVAVKLQEAFGLADTPRLVDGRVPVLFHLLSPARRPLAVTADLSSFWNGPYREVRKEMRGRYPKHPWPENPWTAQATARTTRASRAAGTESK